MTNDINNGEVILKPSHQGGLGLRLRNAREVLGLTREQVAARLKLSVQWIIDMENDDYTRAPALVYVRGNVRAYAKLLGVPEVEAIAELQAMGLEDKATFQQPPNVFRQKPVRAKLPRQWLLIAVIIAIVCFIAIAVYHHFQTKETAVASLTADPQSGTQSNNIIVIPSAISTDIIKLRAKGRE